MGVDLRADRVEAIVLRSVPYGEADLVVHLLARGRGRMGAFARGARKSRRFGGALEPFSVVEALVAERPGADLVTLREASLREGFVGLREDLHRLAHAGYAAELAHDLSRAGQPADPIFDALQGFLERLARGAATSARLRALELALLAGSGLLPELSACARCGAPVAPGRAPFDAASGGLLCGACTLPGATQLSTGARAALQQLAARGLLGADEPQSADGSGRPADSRGFEEAAAQGGPALQRFLVFHLGRAPRSAEFLAQVGAPR